MIFHVDLINTVVHNNNIVSTLINTSASGEQFILAFTFQARNSNRPPVLWPCSCSSETNPTFPTARRTCDTPVGTQKDLCADFHLQRH